MTWGSNNDETRQTTIELAGTILIASADEDRGTYDLTEVKGLQNNCPI